MAYRITGEKSKLGLSKAANQITYPTLSPLASAVKIALVGFGVAHGAANAATIEVNSNLDDGTDCTLQDAITSFNNGALQPSCVNIGGAFGTNDTINIADSIAGDTIVLTSSGGLFLANFGNICLLYTSDAADE